MSDLPSANARFRALFDAHQTAIQSYALRRLDQHDAMDAVAETFAVAWRRIDDVPDGEASRLWLFGVARNVVRNVKRAGRRRIRLDARAHATAQTTGDEPEAVVIRFSEHREVTRALDQLRPHDQEILRLKAWDGLSHAEISSVLGISTGAAEARYARALKRLARQMSTYRSAPTAEKGGRP